MQQMPQTEIPVATVAPQYVKGTDGGSAASYILDEPAILEVITLYGLTSQDIPPNHLEQ